MHPDARTQSTRGGDRTSPVEGSRKFFDHRARTRRRNLDDLVLTPDKPARKTVGLAFTDLIRNAARASNQLSGLRRLSSGHYPAGSCRLWTTTKPARPYRQGIYRLCAKRIQGPG